MSLQPHPTQIANFARDLLHAILAAVFVADTDSQEEKQLRWNAALTAFAGFRPRDTVEAMLVSHILTAHHGLLDSHRQAMLPDMPPQVVLRLRANAAANIRLVTATIHELEKRQARPLPDSLPNVPMPLPATVSDYRPRAAAPAPSSQPAKPACPAMAPSPTQPRDPIHREPIRELPPEPDDGRIGTVGPRAPEGTRVQDMTMAERRVEFGYRYAPEFAEAVTAMDAADPIVLARAAKAKADAEVEKSNETPGAGC